jgi:hypothetical protein
MEKKNTKKFAINKTHFKPVLIYAEEAWTLYQNENTKNLYN